MTRWISCRIGATKSPRRSTDSLAAGARNVFATYDRLVADSAIGSVESVAERVGVGEVVGDPLGSWRPGTGGGRRRRCFGQARSRSFDELARALACKPSANKEV